MVGMGSTIINHNADHFLLVTIPGGTIGALLEMYLMSNMYFPEQRLVKYIT